jgi:hypothetical protein
MPEKTHRVEGTNPRLKEAGEHVKAARESMRLGFQELIPKGFIEHRRAARKEMLLAMRSLLDAAIERTEKKPE